jgi:hypothetical protein
MKDIFLIVFCFKSMLRGQVTGTPGSVLPINADLALKSPFSFFEIFTPGFSSC